MISKADFAKQVLARAGKTAMVAASAGLVLAVPTVPTEAQAWPGACMPMIPIGNLAEQSALAENLLKGLNAKVVTDPGFVETTVDFVEHFTEYLRACDDSDFLSNI